MRYFMYSPLSMSEDQAYEAARKFLRFGSVVHVLDSEIVIMLELEEGQRPTAEPDTYLVRVESDDSLRIVHKALV